MSCCNYFLTLTLSTLGKIFSRLHVEIFFHEYRFSHFMQIETICMKCQILFSGKNEKNIFSLSSSELAQRVVKVKYIFHANLHYSFRVMSYKSYIHSLVGGGQVVRRCCVSHVTGVSN